MSNVGLIAPDGITTYPVITDSAQIITNSNPEIISPIEDKVYAEGFGSDTLLLSDVFEDPDNDKLSYMATNLTKEAVNLELKSDSLLIQEFGLGKDSVIVTATDIYSASVRDSFTLLVKAQTNRPPEIISPIEDKVYAEGFGSDTLLLSDVFEDPDNDKLSYMATNLTKEAVNLELKSDSLLIQESGLGKDSVIIKATDIHNVSINDTFLINVNSQGNQSPLIIDTIEDTVYNEGFNSDTILLNRIFKDPDGDPLIFESTSNENIIETIVFMDSLFIKEKNYGETDILITADDQKGGEAEVSFNVTVNAIPYVLSSIQNKEFTEGFGNANINLSDFFNDKDSEFLVYNVFVDDTSIVIGYMEDDILIIEENNIGETYIEIIAEDQHQASASDDFYVNVIKATDIDIPTTKKYILYPNPTKDKVIIEGILDNVKLSIINIIGNTLYQEISNEKNKISIDIKNYPNGIYLLKLEKEGQHKNFKFIKN